MTSSVSEAIEASQSDVVEPAVKRSRLDVASPLDLLAGVTAADKVVDYLHQDNIQ